MNNKCTCYESNRDVLSVIYDPNGNALTHGEIVDRLNGGESVQLDTHVSCVSEIEAERFEYKGFLLQRLNKDNLWYVVKNNQIVNWSLYRNDMTSWIDTISN